jgi:hypothetical protein
VKNAPILIWSTKDNWLSKDGGGGSSLNEMDGTDPRNDFLSSPMLPQDIFSLISKSLGPLELIMFSMVSHKIALKLSCIFIHLFNNLHSMMKTTLVPGLQPTFTGYLTDISTYHYSVSGWKMFEEIKSVYPLIKPCLQKYQLMRIHLHAIYRIYVHMRIPFDVEKGSDRKSKSYAITPSNTFVICNKGNYPRFLPLMNGMFLVTGHLNSFETEKWSNNMIKRKYTTQMYGELGREDLRQLMSYDDFTDLKLKNLANWEDNKSRGQICASRIVYFCQAPPSRDHCLFSLKRSSIYHVTLRERSPVAFPKILKSDRKKTIPIIDLYELRFHEILTGRYEFKSHKAIDERLKALRDVYYDMLKRIDLLKQSTLYDDVKNATYPTLYKLTFFSKKLEKDEKGKKMLQDPFHHFIEKKYEKLNNTHRNAIPGGLKVDLNGRQMRTISLYNSDDDDDDDDTDDFTDDDNVRGHFDEDLRKALINSMLMK